MGTQGSSQEPLHTRTAATQDRAASFRKIVLYVPEVQEGYAGTGCTRPAG
jgi:hypothetical protein